MWERTGRGDFRVAEVIESSHYRYTAAPPLSFALLMIHRKQINDLNSSNKLRKAPACLRRKLDGIEGFLLATTHSASKKRAECARAPIIPFPGSFPGRPFRRETRGTPSINRRDYIGTVLHRVGFLSNLSVSRAGAGRMREKKVISPNFKSINNSSNLSQSPRTARSAPVFIVMRLKMSAGYVELSRELLLAAFAHTKQILINIL